MSILEKGLFMMSIVFFLNMIWKWNQTLLIVILMEVLSVIIMASIFLDSLSHFSFLLVLFSFFVSEALILLTSLYVSMRVLGISNSSLALV